MYYQPRMVTILLNLSVISSNECTCGGGHRGREVGRGGGEVRQSLGVNDDAAVESIVTSSVLLWPRLKYLALSISIPDDK